MLSYHVVFIPKRRKKALWETARKSLGGIFHTLAKQKECEILEGSRDEQSCTHADQNTTQIRSIKHRWIYEREKYHSDLATALQQGKKLYRRTLLGTRIFRINRWTERRTDQEIHSWTRGKWWANRGFILIILTTNGREFDRLWDDPTHQASAFGGGVWLFI